MPVTLMLHIVNRKDWESAKARGEYRAPSLADEGFIHCSTPENVLWVANRFFKSQGDLVLLEIDRARVRAKVQDDTIENGRVFPHIYGPLNVDAVIAVHDFAPQADGSFQLPPAVSPIL